jgi:hypothetical protein
MRIGELTQRLQRAGCGRRQQRVGAGSSHAQRRGALGQEVGLRGRAVVAAAVADAGGQHRQIGRQLLQGLQRDHCPAAAGGVAALRRGDEIHAGRELAHHTGNTATGTAQGHLEDAHTLPRHDRSGVRCVTERERPRRGGAPAVQGVDRDLRVAEVGGAFATIHRDVERQVGGAGQQQVVGRGKHAGSRIEPGSDDARDRRSVVVGRRCHRHRAWTVGRAAAACEQRHRQRQCQGQSSLHVRVLSGYRGLGLGYCSQRQSRKAMLQRMAAAIIRAASQQTLRSRITIGNS